MVTIFVMGCITLVVLAIIGAVYYGVTDPKGRKLEYERKRWLLQQEQEAHTAKMLKQYTDQSDYSSLQEKIALNRSRGGTDERSPEEIADSLRKLERELKEGK